MTKQPIVNNGFKLVTINLESLNCMREPYVLDVGGKKMILRFKCSARDDDYGVLTLESCAE